MTTQVWKVASGTLWPHARVLWERMARVSRRPPKRLRLCESLPLGERRFVAVIEFEQSRFLVGGTSSSLVLLADLGRHRGSDSEEVAALTGHGPSSTRQAGQKTERQTEHPSGNWGGD
jgi:flagellar biogenesis protein FliO